MQLSHFVQRDNHLNSSVAFPVQNRTAGEVHLGWQIVNTDGHSHIDVYEGKNEHRIHDRTTEIFEVFNINAASVTSG